MGLEPVVRKESKLLPASSTVPTRLSPQSLLRESMLYANPSCCPKSPLDLRSPERTRERENKAELILFCVESAIGEGLGLSLLEMNLDLV